MANSIAAARNSAGDFGILPAKQSHQKGNDMRTVVLAITATATLWASSAWAQQPATVQQIARACAGDIERLCGGVPSGQGRIKVCIKTHITKLSAPCVYTLLGAMASEKEP